MTIHEKINAKGNEDALYPSARGLRKIRLIKKNYRHPYEHIYLPDRLYLKILNNQKV